MKRVLFVLAVAVLVVMGFVISAYGANTTVTINGRTNPKIVITVDNATVDFLDFDPDVPQTTAAAFTVTVESNKNYDYDIDADANFVSAPGAYTAGINHLAYQRGGGGYIAFAGGAGNDVLNGESKPGTTYAYDLQLTFGYDEEPAPETYTADIRPTAVQI